MGASVLERRCPTSQYGTGIQPSMRRQEEILRFPSRSIEEGYLQARKASEEPTSRIELLDTCFVVPAWPSPRRLLRTSLRPHSCRSRISDRKGQGECRESLIVVPRQTKKTAQVRLLRGPAGPSRLDARPARVAANPRWQQTCS